MSARKPVVVITGASSGIGRATALRFARKGASVVVAGRRIAALRSLADQCERLGAAALPVPTDVSDEAAVNALADAAVARFGRVDVWVNCAAVSFFSRIGDVPMTDFRRVIEVNVLGYVHGCRAALRVMRPRRRGVIVNVSSIVGVVPQPYTSAYSMSKAAVRALGVSIRSELRLSGERGIRVATVLPATIDTPFFSHAANYTGRRVKAMPPVYTPERVARTIVKQAAAPRREVAVGTMGKAMTLQHAITPGFVEGMMAVQVEHGHLAHRASVPSHDGNLRTPSPHPEDARVGGGWHGRRKTASRRLLTLGLVAAGVVAMRRRAGDA
jgi:NAD(P)-dependent dehydrogenase (short-subunit alcohol dehydrogenase family)